MELRFGKKLPHDGFARMLSFRVNLAAARSDGVQCNFQLTRDNQMQLNLKISPIVNSSEHAIKFNLMRLSTEFSNLLDGALTKITIPNPFNDQEIFWYNERHVTKLSPNSPFYFSGRKDFTELFKKGYFMVHLEIYTFNQSSYNHHSNNKWQQSYEHQDDRQQDRHHRASYNERNRDIFPNGRSYYESSYANQHIRRESHSSSTSRGSTIPALRPNFAPMYEFKNRDQQSSNGNYNSQPPRRLSKQQSPDSTVSTASKPSKNHPTSSFEKPATPFKDEPDENDEDLDGLVVIDEVTAKPEQEWEVIDLSDSDSSPTKQSDGEHSTEISTEPLEELQEPALKKVKTEPNHDQLKTEEMLAFNINGETIMMPKHRLLAESSVLREFITDENEFSESKETTKEAGLALLHYLNTGTLGDIITNVKDAYSVHSLAKKYKIEPMKKLAHDLIGKF